MSTQGFTKKPGAAAPVSSPAAKSVEIKPTPDAVRRRAYELYAKRIAEGRAGDDQSDWAQAERELKK